MGGDELCVFVTELSEGNRVKIAPELVKLMGLKPGMQFMQWIEGNQIIVEPLHDEARSVDAASEEVQDGG